MARQGRKPELDSEQFKTKTSKQLVASVLTNENPEPPIEISEDARVYFDDVCRNLKAANLLGDADLITIARYSRFLAEYEELVKFIKENGVSFTKDTVRGEFICRRPEMNRLEKLELLLYKLEKELGRTPYARLSMKIPNKASGTQKEEAKARLLRAK
jgi:P27 family predicted phage terminase small subunit